MSLEAGMSDSEDHQVIQGPDVLLQDLEGEAVLLNLRNGQYYGMDANSYHMYKMLMSSPSVQAAYEALSQEYDVEPARLRADLDAFLAHLLENGLLIYAGEQPE
jgi:Coenzyme PQQ synthesis protein D (PqqD)